ncbi:MAG: dihydroorotate dehydrogenase electron transfer subunit [Acuticoccus sp.]
MNAAVGPAVLDVDVVVAAVERHPTACRMRLAWPDAFAGARAGQFALVRSLRPGAPPLPRPISLVPAPGGLEMVFNIVGEGTRVLADAEVGEMVALVGPLGNAFSASAEPIVIVADTPHIGTMLALGVERRAAGLADRFVFVTDPAAPHPSDGVVRSVLAQAGLDPQDAAPDTLDAILADHPAAYIAAGAADPAMACVQRFAAARGIAGEASLQAPMACGLSVCQVCIHPAQAGAPFLVCDGPIFPLAQPAFGGGAHS